MKWNLILHRNEMVEFRSVQSVAQNVVYILVNWRLLDTSMPYAPNEPGQFSMRAAYRFHDHKSIWKTVLLQQMLLHASKSRSEDRIFSQIK